MTDLRSVDELAKILWDYNSLNHPIQLSDCILVLGSHDVRVARRGTELFLQGYAPFILFSGNLGRLTAGLWTKPEAESLAEEALRMGVPEEKILYEGQAAIEFEALAEEAEAEMYPFTLGQAQVETRDAFGALIQDVLANVPVSRISAKFHNGLTDVICAAVNRVSEDTGIRTVALSGGVWQNITLLRRTLSLLQADGFQVYIHREVPTNDGAFHWVKP